ncbi:MAG: protein translocase subunit SecF, partial [Steroidobacteraceae bacterium]|nr:protein translocase subunit SecF [Steroidobacteraceae bacterium]
MELFHKTTRYPFMAMRKRWYAVSAVLMLGSLLSLAVQGLNFGIDFTGGVVMEFTFPQPADLEKVRGDLDRAGFGDAAVQSFGTARDVLVRLLPRDNEDVNVVGQNVLAAMQGSAPGVELRRTEVVGPQVGQELAEKGALAILFTFV